MQAKTLVRIVASLVLGGSVLSAASFFASFGASTIVPQIVRLVLTLAICYYLVQGRQWARWLTVVLCAVAVVTAFSTAPGSAGEGGAVTLLRFLGAVYLACLVILLVPPSMWTFFGGGEREAGTPVSGGPSESGPGGGTGRRER